MRYIIVLFGFGLLAGCSAFGTTKIDEVDSTKKQLVFVDANRRALITSDGSSSVKVCSEPSPDVAANLKDILAASVNVKNQTTNTEASGNVNHEASLAIAQLVTRSQGLQNFRDALYRACEARLNGFITDKQFVMLYNNAITSSTALIALEIIANKGLEKDSQLNDVRLKEMLNFVQVMLAQPN